MKRRLAVAAILALAAALRLAAPGASPPGLNQDEAVNAWNAWCLLHTGEDMTGQRWPLFYSHAIGDNRTTLMYYAMMPALAAFGLSPESLRLPAAVAGVAAVAFAIALGARWFGPTTGLVAGLLLALNPWGVFLGRFGIEGSLCPALALGTVWLIAKAGWPPGDRPLRWGWAIAAGLFAGVACYGYWAMRLWVPAALMLMALADPAGVRRLLRTGAGRAAALALLAGLALTTGPLLWASVSDPAVMRRAEMTRLWEPGASPLAIAALIAQRWLVHFDPRFLFVRGDSYELLALPGSGVFLPVSALAMVAGAVALARRAQVDAPSRMLLALVIAYPAGDLLARYDGAHMLRSAPGLGALVLLEAAGLVAIAAWLTARGRAWRVAGTVAAAGALIVAGGYFVRYFGEWNRRLPIWHGYHADLIEATRWIAPRLAGVERVFVTVQGLNQPFAVVRTVLASDPGTWRREPRDVQTPGEWDLWVRDGRFVYLYGQLAQPHYDALVANPARERTLFVARPGELPFRSPVHRVVRGDGATVLEIFEVDL